MNLDSDFWDARPTLRYIHDYARATRIGHDALLLSVLTRISAATPPNVMLPAIVGATLGSLNYFAALYGAPGAGKDLARGGAEMLVPDIRHAITTQPASGEGLAALFAVRSSTSEDDDSDDSRERCISMRALLSLSEIGVLGGISKRTGSTVVATLCSAWSGQLLGAHNKNELNRLVVPAGAYRLAMSCNVQPAAAGALFDHTDVGLPQRFAYANVTDGGAPERLPELPVGEFPFNVKMLPDDPPMTSLDSIYMDGTTRGSLGFHVTVMDFPRIAFAEADRQRLAVLHGDNMPPLDAHILQLRAKTAALLALLDGGRMSVNVEDWQLAGCITEESCRVRDECLEQMHTAKQRSKADYLADDGIAHEMADAKRLEIVRGIILSFLAKHDPAHEGVKGWRVRQGTGKYGRSCYDALESLYEDGKVEKIGPSSDRISSTIWCLST